MKNLKTIVLTSFFTTVILFVCIFGVKAGVEYVKQDGLGEVGDSEIVITKTEQQEQSARPATTTEDITISSKTAKFDECAADLATIVARCNGELEDVNNAITAGLLAHKGTFDSYSCSSPDISDLK